MVAIENTPDKSEPMNRAVFDEITSSMGFENPQLLLAACAVLCDGLTGVAAAQQYTTATYPVLVQSLSRKVTEIRDRYNEYMTRHGLVDVTLAVPPEIGKLLDGVQSWVVKTLSEKSDE